MQTITYSKLTCENFKFDSLDNFKRHQEVNECWSKIDNAYKLVPNKFTEEWDLNKLRSVADDVLKAIDENCIVYGAFCKEEIVGFIYLGNVKFGSTNQYIELVMYQVSQPFRKLGIGKKLFELVSNDARKLGVSKLYISAHSSKESQAVYRKLGCIEAKEINARAAQNEPFDVQMEYKL